MSVNFTSVKCPECGANLPIEEGRTQVFCSYCGTKVLVTNENERIYRHIDEASVKRAEVEQIVRLKELELQERVLEQERIDESKRVKRTIIIFVAWISATVLFLLIGPYNEICFYIGGALGIVGLYGALFWVIGKDSRKNKALEIKNRAAGLLKLDIDTEGIKKKSYNVLESELRSMGFSNIQCMNLHDLSMIKLREGKVAYVSVKGKTISSSSEWFSPNEQIIIAYHGSR